MITFIGDIHADPAWFNPSFMTAGSVQLGDCHLFGYADWVGTADEEPRFFIDGNHDNFSVLNPDAEDVYSITENLMYIPRGYVSNNIVFVGGGESIDKDKRIPGLTYYPEESVSHAQFDRLAKLLDIQVVVSHTCPTFVVADMYKQKLVCPTEDCFNVLFEIWRPSLWIFAHHHKSFKKTELGCEFVCLNTAEKFYLDGYDFLDYWRSTK